MTFGELYEIHVKMLTKDKLLIGENVKDFLREYVDEFGREDTENIIKGIS